MATLGGLKTFGSRRPFGALVARRATPPPATLRQAIYYVLSRDSRVLAVAGERVYPVWPGSPPEYPAAIFSFVGGYDERDYAGKSSSVDRLRVACWADSPEGAEDLAEAVKAALRDYQGRVGGPGGYLIADAWLVNEVDLRVNPDVGDNRSRYQIALDFQINSV